MIEENLKKYKLAFITEQEIDFYGEAKPDSYHFKYLQEYIKDKCFNHPILNNLITNNNADTLSIAICYFNHTAILLNETKYTTDGKVKYGSFACLVLPSEISDELENNLMKIKPYLNNFNQIFFEEAKVIDNVLTDEMINVDSNLSKEEQLEDAISKIRMQNEQISKGK